MFGQVRALWPDPAGICGPGALLGTVECWLSRSRAAAVTGEAGRWPLRWPAGLDAIETFEKKARELHAQANANRALSSSLAHDDAK